MSNRFLASWATCLLALALASPSHAAQDRDRFADRAWQLIAVVESRHVDPPPIEALVASGIEQVSDAVNADLAEWIERIPEEAEAAVMQGFLKDLHDAARRHGGEQEIVNAMTRGISMRIPGGATTVDAETAKVNDSLDGNRYVGVGVILDFSDGRPKILGTYYGGPAHRGGILDGDIVYQVDGEDTAGMGVSRFLDYSRGEVGTDFVYVVGRSGSDERRTVRLTRSVVPRETVVGTERAEDEGWDYGLPSATIAHVKLTDITASTAHELRVAYERIQREDLDSVMLDVRGCRSTNMHATALVADLFLRDGVMGASATRSSRKEYRAGPDALFDTGSVVVLADGMTSGAAEWLADALRRGGATIVGAPTRGATFLYERVDVPGWPVQVRLATGWILDSTGDRRRRMQSVQPDRLVDSADSIVDAARTWLEATAAGGAPR